MATIKIASLPSATSVSDTDLLILDQANATTKLSVLDFKDKLNLVTNETLGSNDGAISVGTSSGKNLQEILDEGGKGVSLDQGGTVQDAIHWVTPEMYSVPSDGVSSANIAITNMFNSPYTHFKFTKGVYLITDLIEIVFNKNVTIFCEEGGSI